MQHDIYFPVEGQQNLYSLVGSVNANSIEGAYWSAQADFNVDWTASRNVQEGDIINVKEEPYTSLVMVKQYGFEAVNGTLAEQPDGDDDDDAEDEQPPIEAPIEEPEYAEEVENPYTYLREVTKKMKERGY